MTTITDKLAAALRECTRKMHGMRDVCRTGREALAEYDFEMATFTPQPATYALAEIRNGTDWPEDVRFTVVSGAQPPQTFAQRCHDFADMLQEHVNNLFGRTQESMGPAECDMWRVEHAVRTLADNAECDPQDYGDNAQYARVR